MNLSSVVVILVLAMATGCNKAYQPNLKRSAANRAAVALNDSNAMKAATGIDFTASGKIPLLWKVDIDLEKGIFFYTDSRMFFSSPVPAQKGIDSIAFYYRGQTDAGPISIDVFNNNCNDNLPKEKPTVKVIIKLAGKTYLGCGKNLFDSDLNDIWLLEFIDRRDIRDIGIKPQPWLEFNLIENKLFGNDGCNSISSNIKIQGNHISFGNFKGTKKACSNSEVSKIFFEMLSNQIVDYKITGERLTLFLSNDSKLVFEKKARL